MPEYRTFKRSVSPALRYYERQFLAKGISAFKACELARRKFQRKGWPIHLREDSR